jgi:hypothetical protein
MEVVLISNVLRAISSFALQILEDSTKTTHHVAVGFQAEDRSLVQKKESQEEYISCAAVVAASFILVF